MRARSPLFVTLAVLTAGALLFAGCPEDKDDPQTDAGQADPGVTFDAGADTYVPPEDTYTPPEDTYTPEDTYVPPQDTYVPPPDTGPEVTTCHEYIACLLETCSGDADKATCMAGAYETCEMVTDGSDAEADLAAALSTCWGDNACALDETAGDFECQRTHCLDPTVACFTGETFGTDDCGDIKACSVDCVDMFGEVDQDCLRDCMSAGAQTSVGFFLDLDLCIQQHCWDAADYDVCAQQVQGNYCALEATECNGDVG